MNDPKPGNVHLYRWRNAVATATRRTQLATNLLNWCDANSFDGCAPRAVLQRVACRSCWPSLALRACSVSRRRLQPTALVPTASALRPPPAALQHRH